MAEMKGFPCHYYTHYIHAKGVSKALSLVPEEWLFKRLLLPTFTCFYLPVAFLIIKQNSKINLNINLKKSKRVVLLLYTLQSMPSK